VKADTVAAQPLQAKSGGWLQSESGTSMARKKQKAEHTSPLPPECSALSPGAQNTLVQQPRFLPLTEATFCSKLVPFMEEECRNLAEFLKEDKELAMLFKKLRLIVVDNGETEGKHYLYVTAEIQDHRFQRNIPIPTAPGISGSSSPDPYREGYANLPVRDSLRSAFIDAILDRARPEHLAKHIERLLRCNYSYISPQHTDRYYLFRVRNLEFSRKLFFISALHLNLVIPITSTLDASEIRDHTLGSKKILLTTQKNDAGFTGFDERLDRTVWELHFSVLAFAAALTFYQDLVHTSLASLFQAVEYLRATGSSKVYEMKKELALLETSDGKKLEDYMDRLLRLCFAPAYEELDIRPQVANRGGVSIRDFIISNISSSHPFLAMLERKGVELLLFDAKNYSGELTTSDLDAFRRYLGDNDKFGNFGIILSRKGVSANCDEHLYRSLIGKGPIVLVLAEEDLMAILDRLDQGRHPVDVLQEKYVQHILQA